MMKILNWERKRLSIDLEAMRSVMVVIRSQLRTGSQRRVTIIPVQIETFCQYNSPRGRIWVAKR